jgi:hypothetical protein
MKRTAIPLAQRTPSRRRAVAATLVALVLTAAIVPTVRGAEPPVYADDFSLTLTPYAWFVGITGDLGARGVVASVDESFLDVLDQSDFVFGVFARAEARKGKLGFFIDGGYTRMEVNDTSVGAGEVDATFDMAAIDFGLLYRVGTWPTAGRTTPALALDAMVGGRYVHGRNEFDFAVIATREQSKDWIDPIVGAQALVNFNERFGVILRGDVGGFGVASDLTWSATALVTYRFHLGGVRSEAFLGYKALGEDFSDGSGVNEFTWDTVTHGPVLGFTFTF